MVRRKEALENLLLHGFDSCLGMIRDLLRIHIQQDICVQKGGSARSRLKLGKSFFFLFSQKMSPARCDPPAWGPPA